MILINERIQVLSTIGTPYLPEHTRKLMNNARSGSEIVDILCGVKGIDVNPKDYLGRTPLMVACITGNEAAVRSLCAQPEIDLYCKDNEGRNFKEMIKKDSSVL